MSLKVHIVKSDLHVSVLSLHTIFPYVNNVIAYHDSFYVDHVDHRKLHTYVGNIRTLQEYYDMELKNPWRSRALIPWSVQYYGLNANLRYILRQCKLGYWDGYRDEDQIYLNYFNVMYDLQRPQVASKLILRDHTNLRLDFYEAF